MKSVLLVNFVLSCQYVVNYPNVTYCFIFAMRVLAECSCE